MFSKLAPLIIASGAAGGCCAPEAFRSRYATDGLATEGSEYDLTSDDVFGSDVALGAPDSNEPTTDSWRQSYEDNMEKLDSIIDRANGESQVVDTQRELVGRQQAEIKALLDTGFEERFQDLGARIEQLEADEPGIIEHSHPHHHDTQFSKDREYYQSIGAVLGGLAGLAMLLKVAFKKKPTEQAPVEQDQQAPVEQDQEA